MTTVAEPTETLAEPVYPDLTADRVMELLEQVVAEQGADYVVDYCSYYHDDPARFGQPNCIVGHVLAKHGVNLVDMFGGRNALLLDHMLLGFITPEAKSLLREAQSWQDSKFTWGRALKATRKLYDTLQD